jgi:hypothetical protein
LFRSIVLEAQSRGEPEIVSVALLVEMHVRAP